MKLIEKLVRFYKLKDDYELIFKVIFLFVIKKKYFNFQNMLYNQIKRASC